MRTDVAARTLALLIAALSVGLTIRYNTFAAWATDSGAYLSQGQAWANADLFRPATFLNWAPWSLDGQMEAPLGHVVGDVRGTITGQYPLGYPVLLAVAMKAGGDLAAHAVSPILAGLMVWCAFLVGRQLSTAWGGVIAAALVALSPVTFWHAIMPFSDVPAAAFWALAWAMSLRPGAGAAAAAGAATAMAVMIRPNLAPLGAAIGLAVLLADRGSWRHHLRRVVVYGVLAALGPAIVMWSQAVLYGHPMQTGYRVPMSYFFSTARIRYNAGLYPRMLNDLHTWLALGGLLLAPVAIREMRRDSAAWTRGVIALSAVVLILINYALYLPYLTYVGWHWLRFLLPALVALFVLLGAGVDRLRVWLAQRWRHAALLALVPAVVVVWSARDQFYVIPGYERILMMQRYLAEALPRDATILTYAHGGALAAATNRWMLRLDMIAPGELEGILRDLARRGHRPVYVFDVAIDGAWFGDRFRDVTLARLTWPARAEITSVTSIVAYELRDREAFFSGERWPIDVLVEPPSAAGTVDWSSFRTTHERILLPRPEETAAFRAALEATYRNQLGRAPSTAAAQPHEVVTWLRRYIRFRLHGCAHEVATAKIWQQMDAGGAPSLCAQPDGVSFPAQNETVAFRQALETKLQGRTVRPVPTAVDAVGEAVWMQTYLEARVAGCSHRAAVVDVQARITGQGQRCR